jgi:hypothetical protein
MKSRVALVVLVGGRPVRRPLLYSISFQNKQRFAVHKRSPFARIVLSLHHRAWFLCVFFPPIP